MKNYSQFEIQKNLGIFFPSLVKFVLVFIKIYLNKKKLKHIK